jgi:Tfp pilus assembly protein PilN
MTPQMNLVPLTFQRKLLVRRRVRQWFLPCALALIISLTAVGEVGYRLRILTLESRALEEQLAPMNEMSLENDRLTSQLKALVGHESVLNEIAGVQRPISLLAVISRSAAAVEQRLQIHKLSVSQSSVDSAAGKGSSPAIATEITIHGIALDDADVAAFVRSLDESKAFSAVELKSTAGAEVMDVAVRQYDVMCRR